MALRINTNIAAMNSYRNLSVTDDQMSKSLEKLSSGFRINRAADDAAGLAISEGLRSQVSGLKVATRNAQDGISVVQTAEGALSETHSILQRMRDLSVQASNDGGLNADAKGAIQSELGQLKSELSRIADTTKFNGKSLLDGSYSGTFQVGANAGQTISVGVNTAMSASGLGVAGVDVTAVASNAATGTVTAATGTTAANVANTFTGATDFASATVAADFSKLNGTISYGGKNFDLASVKYTEGATNAVKLGELNTAANAALGTTTNRFTATATGVTWTAPEAPVAGATAQKLAEITPVFTKASGASEAINLIDAAVKKVSTVRGDLGALQNRFDHTINNLNVTVENLSASESRIRDADMAQEMVKFTRNQILSQAGTAMLAQANQSSQGVLSLLR